MSMTFTVARGNSATFRVECGCGRTAVQAREGMSYAEANAIVTSEPLYCRTERCDAFYVRPIFEGSDAPVVTVSEAVGREILEALEIKFDRSQEFSINRWDAGDFMARSRLADVRTHKREGSNYQKVHMRLQKVIDTARYVDRDVIWGRLDVMQPEDVIIFSKDLVV